MIKLKQMRTLLCGKPVKQTKQKKKHRTMKAVLLSTVIGLLWMCRREDGKTTFGNQRAEVIRQEGI